MKTKALICLLMPLALLSISQAAAQQGGKRLYCWEEGGRRVCGDALPSEAASRARQEFSARTGRQTASVERAMTDAERAVREAEQAREQREAEAEAARQRRDLAMVQSYRNEDDLRRAYAERIELVEASIVGSQLGQASLRESLASVLGQAADLELANRPVPERLLENIAHLRAELTKQIRTLQMQQRDRQELDGDLENALQRYRTMRGGK